MAWLTSKRCTAQTHSSAPAATLQPGAVGEMLQGGDVFPKAPGCCQKWPGTSLHYLCSLSVVCCSAETRKSCRHHQKPCPVGDRHTDLPWRTQPGLSLPLVMLLDANTAQTKARHQVSPEIRPPWAKVATWLSPALEAGPRLLLEMDHSLVTLQFTLALGTAVTIAHITRKQCHALFPSIPVRGKGHPNSSEEQNVHWAAPRQPVSVQSAKSRQDRGKQVRHRAGGHQVDLLHTGMKVFIKKNYILEY